MDKSQIQRILSSEGFSCTHETEKLAEFTKGVEVVYLKKVSSSHPMVLHGKHASRVGVLTSIGGVVRTKPQKSPYHNSNMRHFDLRNNTGKKPTRYGFDFDFSSESGLRSLLSRL